MPSGKSWLYFIIINILFFIGIFIIYFYSLKKSIKREWMKYRCNPMFLVFSENMEKDFVYCVQNTQKGMMGYFLEPFTWILSNMSNSISSIQISTDAARNMFEKTRSLTGFNIGSVYGVFLNIVIEFQKIIIGIKNLLGRTIGIMTTLLYIMEGTMMTTQSAWNGPPGQMTRRLGSCFHPETQIKLENGEIVFMKDLNLGDVLENKSVVKATMKIQNVYNNKNNKYSKDNKDKEANEAIETNEAIEAIETNEEIEAIETNEAIETIYKIPKKGVNGSDIFVTGSHFILDRYKTNKFIEVSKYKNAVKCSQEINPEYFSCIITNDHIIKIGEETFWDWEDYMIRS